METLIISVDNKKDANALIAQLNQLTYVKGIIWSKIDTGTTNHLLPGEPMLDEELSRLLDEAEQDLEIINLNRVEDKMKSNFKSA